MDNNLQLKLVYTYKLWQRRVVEWTSAVSCRAGHMRKKYLADGLYSPMSEMISLLAYSKHAALNQGNAGNAYWSADKKIFYLNGRPIVIESFRKMAQSMEAEVVEQFWQLCWVDIVADRFTIDLAQISDDVTFTTRGESFVTNPANRPSNGLAWMLRQARSKEGGMQLRFGPEPLSSCKHCNDNRDCRHETARDARCVAHLLCKSTVDDADAVLARTDMPTDIYMALVDIVGQDAYDGANRVSSHGADKVSRNVRLTRC
jgi:hypothetical protein